MIGLKSKGETAEEIASLAKVMREQAMMCTNKKFKCNG